MIRPAVNEIIDIITLDMMTVLNFLNSCMLVMLGKIIRLDIKSEPIIRIPRTTTMEHNILNSIL